MSVERGRCNVVDDSTFFVQRCASLSSETKSRYDKGGGEAYHSPATLIISALICRTPTINALLFADGIFGSRRRLPSRASSARTVFRRMALSGARLWILCKD